MSTGQVIFVSGNGAMIVVSHDDGYALVEMIGDEGALAVGDTCSADWDALGGETIRSNGDRYDGYLQGSWGDKRVSIEMAVNMGGPPVA
jgi:hypothetical protein